MLREHAKLTSKYGRTIHFGGKNCEGYIVSRKLKLFIAVCFLFKGFLAAFPKNFCSNISEMGASERLKVPKMAKMEHLEITFLCPISQKPS